MVHPVCELSGHLVLQIAITSGIVYHTEAEYIALSQALRDVIPVMALLEEMR